MPERENDQKLWTIREWSARHGLEERQTRHLISTGVVSPVRLNRRVFLTDGHFASLVAPSVASTVAANNAPYREHESTIGARANRRVAR